MKPQTNRIRKLMDTHNHLTDIHTNTHTHNESITESGRNEWMMPVDMCVRQWWFKKVQRLLLVIRKRERYILLWRLIYGTRMGNWEKREREKMLCNNGVPIEDEKNSPSQGMIQIEYWTRKFH